MKKFVIFSILLLSYVGIGHSTSTPSPTFLLPSVNISSTGVSGAAITATIPAPNGAGAFSTGYTNYITHVHIEMYAVAALTGGATPITCTTVNFAGITAWKFPTAAAIGTVTITDEDYSSPLTSPTPGSLSSLTCPATTNVIWNMRVGFTQTQ